MRFYRIDASLNSPAAWKRRYEKTDDRQALIEEINTAAQQYNGDRSVFERFYPTALSKDRFSLCAAAEGAVGQPDATAFLSDLGERFGKISVTEIGFGAFCEALKRGERKDLLDDADDILKELGLEKLDDCFGYRYLDCGEGLLKKTGNTFPKLIRTAKQTMVGDTLIPELERIRDGKTRTDYPGHPVHYFVETADRDLRKTLTHLLMQGLLLRKRIQNLRYTYLNVPADWNYSKEGFEELYKSSKGGVVLIRYNGGVEEDGECAGGELKTINAISDMARRYRNQVLTIFCMSRGQQTSKRLLLEKIRDLRIVELKEDLVPQERAEEQMRAYAAKRGLPAEPALLDRLKESDVFYASELNKLFEEWFNDQLCSNVFPQYNEFSAPAKTPSGGTGTAVAELNAMIGLTEAKNVLRQVIDYHLVKQIFKDRNIPQDFPCAHMVFTGNPGTAKTTAARLFARALKENGILPTGHLVEVGRCDLVGQYVGWTAVQVKKKFEDAKGGVLFIDEAYSLTDDRDGSYGDEAINTIVQEMENHRSEMIVILAGYPDRMETFLDKNPGLRSRIAFHVPFKDYSEEELCDISRMIAEKQGCILSDSFTDRLPDLFRVAKDAPDFGNGRYVRNMLEQAKMNHATRILQMDRAAVTETALRTLSAEDLPAPRPSRAVPVRKIGFGI